MKLLCLLSLLALATPCLSGEFGDYQDDPKVFLKIVSALESSKELGSSVSEPEIATSHLVSAKFLGTVVRNAKKYTLAYAFFVRSSPRGRDTPPARGHHFIVVLDPEWKIAGKGKVEMGDYYMIGTELFARENAVYPVNKGEAIADFASTAPQVRSEGFVLLNMPYPFPDRLSEEDYQSGKFEKKTK